MFQIILIAVIVVYMARKNRVIVIKTSGLETNSYKADGLRYFYDLKPNDKVLWPADFIKNTVTNVYNNDGLNDTKNYLVVKEPKTFRIIALGDSFTFGVYVETKNNWTELLENKLNEKPLCKNIDKFEVLNFGVPGYDQVYEVEKYKKSGQKYNPDLVIWMLTESVRINELRNPIFEECKNGNNDTTTVDYCWIYANNRIKDEYGMDYIVAKQRETISNLRKIYNKHIYFVDYFNVHGQIVKDVPDSTDFSNILTKNYLLKNYSKDKIQFPDTHPNELGHKLIADILFDQLFKTKQIPCDKY